MNNPITGALCALLSAALAHAARSETLEPRQAARTSTVAFSAETRVRYDTQHNVMLRSGEDQSRALLRAVVGADWRPRRGLRFYAEMGTGQADATTSLGANFENDASLQQLFVDAQAGSGDGILGAVVGRQEFSEGPCQLISVSDGPNLHRSWNGVRLYARAQRGRIDAFDFRATRLRPGSFDETVDSGERLQGLSASYLLGDGEAQDDIVVEPFWFRTVQPVNGGTPGRDRRDTHGARVVVPHGRFRADWTIARQTGRRLDREVDAWAVFAVHSVLLADTAPKPRLTARIDVASGGSGARSFNPLYASSSYIGEAQFLGLTNLLLVTPGASFTPSRTTTVSFEYGVARRMSEDDAVYAAQKRPYAATRLVRGRTIGAVARATAVWKASDRLKVAANLEHLGAGDVLERAGLSSSTYGHVSATWRY